MSGKAFDRESGSVQSCEIIAKTFWNVTSRFDQGPIRVRFSQNHRKILPLNLQALRSLTLAIAILLAAALPMYAVKWGGNIWWPASTIFLVGVLVGFGASLKSRSACIALVLVFSACLLFANCLVAASYYIQRVGINQQFVDQLNFNARFALRGYYLIAFGALLYVVAGSAAAVASSIWLRSPDMARFRGLGAVTLLVATIVFTPTFQTLLYFFGKVEPENQTTRVAVSEPVQDQLLASPPPDRSQPKSLVLIYLEGIEAAFFDIPGLMPKLDRIRDRMIEFNNIRQAVGGTIGGIVSTQCGWPPYSGSSLYEDPEFYPGLECLGDIVKAHGYTSHFMGGADLRFTSKDRFFVTHGFSSVAGLKELRPLLDDPEYVSKKWGIWDDSLFELGRDRFDELATGNSPFMLVFLTIATHVPGFAAPTCPDYKASDNPLLEAVHCTDLLVAEFIDHVRQSSDSDNVLIALVSDHYMWGGIEPLGIQVEDDDRRLVFMVDDPLQPGRKDPVAGTELDIGPTLLALMDIGQPRRIGLGTSLLDGQGQLVSEASGFRNIREIQKYLRSDEVKERLEKVRSKERAVSN